jgi:hypothetical protein
MLRMTLLLYGMHWLEGKMKRLAAMPWYLLFAHFVSRTMIGIGVGLLLADLFEKPARHGWINIGIGLAIGLPSTFWAFRVNRGKNKERT